MCSHCPELAFPDLHVQKGRQVTMKMQLAQKLPWSKDGACGGGGKRRVPDEGESSYLAMLPQQSSTAAGVATEVILHPLSHSRFRHSLTYHGL